MLLHENITKEKMLILFLIFIPQISFYMEIDQINTK